MSENTNVVLDENVQDVALIKKDRMRFSKNKLSANLSLLALVVNVVYFVIVYKLNNNFFYQIKVGLSVLYNLVFMLMVFLCSEGIKSYKLNYGIVLIAVGALQIARVFYLPMQANAAGVTNVAQFIALVACLVASAAILIVAGVIGIIRSKALQKYREEIGEEQPS